MPTIIQASQNPATSYHVRLKSSRETTHGLHLTMLAAKF